MRNKLIELLDQKRGCFCDLCKDDETADKHIEETADHLLANGVTLQTAPISYERLLHIARQMHLWIFLNCADEQKAYDELKITEEENVVFGYGGKLEITMPEPPKENE